MVLGSDLFTVASVIRWIAPCRPACGWPFGKLCLDCRDHQITFQHCVGTTCDNVVHSRHCKTVTSRLSKRIIRRFYVRVLHWKEPVSLLSSIAVQLNWQKSAQNEKINSSMWEDLTWQEKTEKWWSDVSVNQRTAHRFSYTNIWPNHIYTKSLGPCKSDVTHVCFYRW